MPLPPSVEPKYVLKVILKSLLRSIVFEFHAEPVCHVLFVVSVTPAPLVKAFPFVIHEAHNGAVVVKVHVGVVVKDGVMEFVGVIVDVSAVVDVSVGDTIGDGVGLGE
jgi:hypothetical protein